MKRFAKTPWRRIRNLLLTVILVSIVVIAGACQAPPISEDALATEVAATIYAEQVAGTSAGASPAYTTSTPHTSALEPLATSTPQPTPTSSLPQVGTPLPASLNPIMPDNVGEMEPLALWGRGIINGLAYSPDGSVLAMPNTPKACLECHDVNEFEMVHMHKLESLATCQLCHQAHGSTTKKWLKDADEVLCTMCHE